jgi:alpha-glucosidase
MAFLPVLVDVKNGPKIAITESDLDDYPGLYVKGSADGSPSLFGLFPAYPLKEEQRRDRTLEVKERADYIAQTKGTRTFPWRALLIARRDADLIESDFVSKYGIEYIILDEGWSDPADLFKVNATIDMPQLLAYAREKNVGIILWCVWLTLDRQLQEALDLFERWGVKGIKVDFMDRDDQKVVNFYRRVAAAAAQRRLEFDFLGEGAWKAEIYADGVNASKYASDYKKTTMAVKPGDIVKIKLAPGGGWAARLFK